MEMKAMNLVKSIFNGSFTVLADRSLRVVADIPLPGFILTSLVKAYVAWFDVDMSQVMVPPGGFGTFGEFFARKLRPEARPVCNDHGAVVSPCDAVILEKGRLENGGESVLTIKGMQYSVRELVADVSAEVRLAGGGYCVFYLHPRDYHRVHVPVDSIVREVRHIPGARYPVAPWASKLAGGALGKNERIAFDLELSGSGKKCVLLMVAAFGVDGIECGISTGAEKLPNGVQRTSCGESLVRGDEIGAFRLGSTVVLLWPKDVFEIDESLLTGNRVCAGQRIGRVL